MTAVHTNIKYLMLSSLIYVKRPLAVKVECLIRYFIIKAHVRLIFLRVKATYLHFFKMFYVIFIILQMRSLLLWSLCSACLISRPVDPYLYMYDNFLPLQQHCQVNNCNPANDEDNKRFVIIY